MKYLKKNLVALSLCLVSTCSVAAQEHYPLDVIIADSTIVPDRDDIEVVKVDSEYAEVTMDKVNMCNMKGIRFEWDELVIKIPENQMSVEELSSVEVYISNEKYSLDLSSKGKYTVRKGGRSRYFELVDSEFPYYEIIIDEDDYVNAGWPLTAIVDIKTKSNHETRLITDIVQSDENMEKQMPFSIFFEQGYIGTNLVEPVKSGQSNVEVKYYVEYADYAKTFSIDVPTNMAHNPMFYEVLNSKDMKRLEIYYQFPSDGSLKKSKYKVQLKQEGSAHFNNCELPLR